MSSKSEDVRPRAALCASAAQNSVDKWWFTQKRWFIRKDNKDETSELQIQHRLKKRASSECVHSSFVESSINLVPLLILQQNPPTLTFGPGQRRGIFRFMFYDVVTQGSSQNKTNTLPTIWMVTSCSFCSWLVENSGIEPLTSCMPCKRSPERYRNTPPHESAGTGLISRWYVLSTKKVHSCILLPGIMLRLQGNFTTQFLSVSMGFAQREGHLREKFFLTAYLAQFWFYTSKLRFLFSPKVLTRRFSQRCRCIFAVFYP